MNRFRSERGQTMVLTTFFVVALLGMAALVSTSGPGSGRSATSRPSRTPPRWPERRSFPTARASRPRERRSTRARTTAPTRASPSAARSAASGRTRSTSSSSARRPGFFAKVFGVNSVDIRAKAAAKAGYPSAARWVAPIVVDEEHPMLLCSPRPCFGSRTTIELEHLHGPGEGTAAGSFALISLDNSQRRTRASLAEWLLNGYDGLMELGDYHVVPSGAKFNSGQFRDCARAADEHRAALPDLLARSRGSGSTADYEVIGWIGFVDRGGRPAAAPTEPCTATSRASSGRASRRRPHPPWTTAFVQSSSSNEPRLRGEEPHDDLPPQKHPPRRRARGSGCIPDRVVRGELPEPRRRGTGEGEGLRRQERHPAGHVGGRPATARSRRRRSCARTSSRSPSSDLDDDEGPHDLAVDLQRGAGHARAASTKRAGSASTRRSRATSARWCSTAPSTSCSPGSSARATTSTSSSASARRSRARTSGGSCSATSRCCARPPRATPSARRSRPPVPTARTRSSSS